MVPSVWYSKQPSRRPGKLWLLRKCSKTRGTKIESSLFSRCSITPTAWRCDRVSIPTVTSLMKFTWMLSWTTFQTRLIEWWNNSTRWSRRCPIWLLNFIHTSSWGVSPTFTPKASAIVILSLRTSSVTWAAMSSSCATLALQNNLWRENQMFLIFVLGIIEHQSLSSVIQIIQHPLMSGVLAVL